MRWTKWGFEVSFISITWAIFSLTLLMLGLYLSKDQGHKTDWKAIQPCHHLESSCSVLSEGNQCARTSITFQVGFFSHYIVLSQIGHHQWKDFSSCFILLACGGTFTDPTGDITSPHHPAPYPSGSSCSYLITMPPGRRVILMKHTFDLESSATCQHDYLKVGLYE